MEPQDERHRRIHWGIVDCTDLSIFITTYDMARPCVLQMYRRAPSPPVEKVVFVVPHERSPWTDAAAGED